MTQVGIQLVDGPADGMEVVIPRDPWDPPEVYEIHQLTSDLRGVLGTYRRELNLGDDGPLWRYRYAGETS